MSELKEQAAADSTPEDLLEIIPDDLLVKEQAEITSSEKTESEYSSRLKSLELGDKEEDLSGKKQDREERKKFGILTFRLVVAYLGVIFLFIFLAGLGCVRLSDAVLIALITTLATNVLGIFYFVMKYLFSK